MATPGPLPHISTEHQSARRSPRKKTQAPERKMNTYHVCPSGSQGSGRGGGSRAAVLEDGVANHRPSQLAFSSMGTRGGGEPRRAPGAARLTARSAARLNGGWRPEQLGVPDSGGSQSCPRQGGPSPTTLDPRARDWVLVCGAAPRSPGGRASELLWPAPRFHFGSVYFGEFFPIPELVTLARSTLGTYQNPLLES